MHVWRHCDVIAWRHHCVISSRDTADATWAVGYWQPVAAETVHNWEAEVPVVDRHTVPQQRRTADTTAPRPFPVHKSRDAWRHSRKMTSAAAPTARRKWEAPYYLRTRDSSCRQDRTRLQHIHLHGHSKFLHMDARRIFFQGWANS